MKYSAEEFSRAGDQFLGRSYEEMDCQALVERMMAAVGYRRDLGGSNSWYRECRSNGWTGTPEECVKEFGSVPKGALLFIREDVSASTPGKFRSDGIGDITHMGVKTGRGDGAIHSSHSRGCVCTSKFRDRTIPNGGWNRVGLLNVFSYGKTVDWVLEHGGGNDQSMSEVITEVPNHMYVVGPNNETVNLRKKPNGALIERIRTGEIAEILEEGPTWSRIDVGGRIGWMMTQYLNDSMEEVVPDVPEGEPEPMNDSEDPSAALLAEVYRTLKELCEKIEYAIAKG